MNAHIYAAETRLTRSTLPKHKVQGWLSRNTIIDFEGCYEVYAHNDAIRKFQRLAEYDEKQNVWAEALAYADDVEDNIFVLSTYGNKGENE